GQSYELKIPVERGALDADGLQRLRAAFDEEHRREFGHNFPEFDVELVNLRLTGIGTLPHLQHIDVSGASVEDARVGEAEVGFVTNGSVERLATSLYERDLLPVGEEVAGPAIVVQLDSTTLVPPGASVRRDAIGNLAIKV